LKEFTPVVHVWRKDTKHTGGREEYLTFMVVHMVLGSGGQRIIILFSSDEITERADTVEDSLYVLEEIARDRRLGIAVESFRRTLIELTQRTTGRKVTSRCRWKVDKSEYWRMINIEGMSQNFTL
jgi:hypothetical protein